jgi:hypothetical protein
LSKDLYGLKQAPRAWYERLRDFLIEKGFTIGKVDTTLFTKKLNGEIFICQVYRWPLIVFANFRKTFGVTSQWLIGRFDNLDTHAGPGTVETYARVWLWHFLGTFLFLDASGNVVSWIFLDILRQPWENIALFSWDNAVLAWTYRQLCAACCHGSGYPSLGGCSYLL